MLFHRKYLEVVAEIERRFQVQRWQYADVSVWPLARMDLYNDLVRAHAGETAPAVTRTPLPLRALARAAVPATNLWKSRQDLDNYLARPRAATAVLLGDGVSLDRVNGRWQDRFGEPVIRALERRGQQTFLMQSSELTRLPWRRPTYAANRIAARAAFGAPYARHRAVLPDYGEVLQFLRSQDVRAPSLGAETLARRAAKVAATAAAFERVLRIVRPELAFVVTWYAGLGAAFALACRRLGILSIDLQHCPQEGAHKAYQWSHPPDGGYSTLPAIFWNWTAQEAQDIQAWARTLPCAWHRAVHGGHTQIAELCCDSALQKACDQRIHAAAGDVVFDKEILLTLQPIGGRRLIWDAIAEQIERSPASWRWWIRRHPASTRSQDTEYARVLALRGPNIEIELACELPLPILLRWMTVTVSLESGAAVEAATLGIPALFLSGAAAGPFARILDAKLAKIINVDNLTSEITLLRDSSGKPAQFPTQPSIDETLIRLQELARQYAQLCGSQSQRR